jgi:DNA topoisomerase-2
MEYQVLEQREHALQRPETYIGPVEAETVHTLVVEGSKLAAVEVESVPGLLKLFDEVLVNACDNKQRDPAGMTQLAVNFVSEGPDAGAIRIRNNGQGLPVAEHPKEKVWIPVLVFGTLLTSSNFNDKNKKTVGGRNGFGAKLANIFSVRFRLRTGDGTRQLAVEWTDHMLTQGPVKVAPCKSQFTEVTFWPDYGFFRLPGLPSGVKQLMERRVYDVAGCTPSSLTVKLDGTTLPSTFAAYCSMLPGAVLLDKCARWEVGILPAATPDLGHLAFVNGIHTRMGGTHATHVLDQLCKVLAEQLQTKHKLTLRKGLLREGLLVVVNALIENPTFEGQCKHQLTTKPKDFGSRYTPSPAFLAKLKKGGEGSVMARLVDMATDKQDQALSKQDGKKKARVNVAKLTDARKAGTAHSMICVLVLTEGDSAQALAVAGISAAPDPASLGSLPLRGKLLNVRSASRAMLLANKEVQDLIKAMGLQHGKAYVTEADFKTLRYGGGIMLMADQDYDGFHIGGLILNLFEHLWPSLLARPGFFRRMQTPIVKVSRGATVHQFFRLAEFEAWVAAQPEGWARAWTTKYYKGLGTSTAKEGKEYFADLGRHLITFVPSDKAHAALDMAFHKDRTAERKTWLRATSLEQLQQQAGVTDTQTIPAFVDDQLVQFSLYNNERAIPRMVHGLKPGQLKVLTRMLQLPGEKDQKVAQLGPDVAQTMGYHHGETSLANTIVTMAQDYVGANNLNLLVPSGQFGTRLQGGKDAASARYIYTRLHPLARLIFRAEDDPVLHQRMEEGQKIEKELVPILPLVLINGASGIGTGWSTCGPPHHPLAVLRNTRRLLQGEALLPLQPWFRGFAGTVVLKEGSYETHGRASWNGRTTVEVTELPIGMWTASYREHLQKLVEKGVLKDYAESHTDRKVHFELGLKTQPTAEPTTADTVSVISGMGSAPARRVPPALAKLLKLSKSASTTNMHLFSPEGRIEQYLSAEEIFRQHHTVRLHLYGERKRHQLAELQRQIEAHTERVRFVQLLLAGTVVLKGVEIADLERLLSVGWGPTPPPPVTGLGPVLATDSVLEQGFGFADPAKLLALPMSALTATAVVRLLATVAKKKEEHAQLSATTPSALWLADLAALEEGLELHWQAMPDDSITGKRKR